MPLVIKKSLLTLCLLSCATADGHQVIGIQDGDTMTLLVEGKPVKIRLANIDAPEKKQPFGEKSKQSLSQTCWGKDAQYVTQGVDRYKRQVAVVYCDGVSANVAQITSGMAWVYSKYNQDISLVANERVAMKAGIGLWSDSKRVAPWVWRRENKNSRQQARLQSSNQGIK